MCGAGHGKSRVRRVGIPIAPYAPAGISCSAKFGRGKSTLATLIEMEPPKAPRAEPVDRSSVIVVHVSGRAVLTRRLDLASLASVSVLSDLIAFPLVWLVVVKTGLSHVLSSDPFGSRAGGLGLSIFCWVAGALATLAVIRATARWQRGSAWRWSLTNCPVSATDRAFTSALRPSRSRGHPSLDAAHIREVFGKQTRDGLLFITGPEPESVSTTTRVFASGERESLRDRSFLDSRGWWFGLALLLSGVGGLALAVGLTAELPIAVYGIGLCLYGLFGLARALRLFGVAPMFLGDLVCEPASIEFQGPLGTQRFEAQTAVPVVVTRRAPRLHSVVILGPDGSRAEFEGCTRVVQRFLAAWTHGSGEI